ncbi:uncharacterized protein LOC117547349 [Gymnodraco acuticeps]|uniref:Uncharacterized protein LOC117547349 n=1 Tax=Gymnodraco acuticeps TaxID=8218 RepID=A0A6P8UP50_GYMAC|nr:uncharacterized protein LOC117547349 [Gymnodraco acuticeps]
MEARRGVLVFSTFGKTRKITITKEVLLAVTDKLRATTKTKDNDEGDEKDTFWGEVCQELGISDSKTNRTRLHHAYNHHKKMRHKTQMVTAAPASPSTDSDHTACPIDGDHSSTDIDRTVPATPSSVRQAFTETSEPEDVSECNSSGTYDSSSHSKDGQLLHSFKLPSNPSFFFVTKSDWKKLRMRQHKRRFKSLNWTSVMATGIRSVHPHCCFVFKSHSVQTVGSKRKGSLFSCVGYCRFDDCPVEVEVDIEDESSLKAVVTFRGEKAWHNCEELKHRPVRADERDALANALTSKLPRSVYLDKLNKLDDTVLASGNRDQVPSTGVMKTLSWQARKKLRKHSNEMISLRKMMEEELETEEAVIKKNYSTPQRSHAMVQQNN